MKTDEPYAILVGFTIKRDPTARESLGCPRAYGVLYYPVLPVRMGQSVQQA